MYLYFTLPSTLKTIIKQYINLIMNYKLLFSLQVQSLNKMVKNLISYRPHIYILKIWICAIWCFFFLITIFICFQPFQLWGLEGPSKFKLPTCINKSWPFLYCLFTLIKSYIYQDLPLNRFLASKFRMKWPFQTKPKSSNIVS